MLFAPLGIRLFLFPPRRGIVDSMRSEDNLLQKLEERLRHGEDHPRLIGDGEIAEHRRREQPVMEEKPEVDSDSPWPGENPVDALELAQIAAVQLCMELPGRAANLQGRFRDRHQAALKRLSPRRVDLQVKFRFGFRH
jgi:hypothetical protein